MIIPPVPLAELGAGSMVKGLLLALALHGADAGTLGIGMDVLPEAFSFAASRVSYAPHLTLATCDDVRCRWNLGAGVRMTASLAPGTLTVNRIEAETLALAPTSPGSPYAKACSAIVALLAPRVAPNEQRSIALSIATPERQMRQVKTDMPDMDYRFYGSSEARTGGVRCGAAASSIDSKL